MSKCCGKLGTRWRTGGKNIIDIAKQKIGTAGDLRPTRDGEIAMDRQKQNLRWVKTWQKAAVSLQKLKAEELRSKDYYEKNRKVLDEMLQYACDNCEVRLSSGLVEQQRLFMRMKQPKTTDKDGQS